MSMEKVSLAETWMGDGCIAVRQNNGTYRVFIDPALISITTTNGFGVPVQIQSLAEMPTVASIVSDAKASVVNQLLKESREDRDR